MKISQGISDENRTQTHMIPVSAEDIMTAITKHG
jgi:hypothetical protein